MVEQKKDTEYKVNSCTKDKKDKSNFQTVHQTQTLTITEQIRKLKMVKKRRVTWTPDTIDNSKMNRKKSKVCCIFHRDEIDEPCGENANKNKYERS